MSSAMLADEAEKRQNAEFKQGSTEVTLRHLKQAAAFRETDSRGW